MAEVDEFSEIDINPDDLEQMTVVQIKEHLKRKSLSTSGNKPVLVKRLKDWLLNAENQILQGATDGNYSINFDEDAALLSERAVLDDVAAVSTKPPTQTDTPASTTDTTAAAISDTKKPVTISADTNNSTTEKGSSSETKTESEARLERAKRFNVEPGVEDKKTLRAQRFGISSESATGGAISTKPEALKKRAERFGIPVKSPTTTTTATSVVSDEKLKSRADRFGDMLDNKKVSSGAVSVAAVDPETLLKRKARFGVVAPATAIAEIEIKKTKRAERFAV